MCRDCYLDGFGKNGARGLFMKHQIEKDEARYKKNENKIPLWINNELRLVDKVIEVTPTTLYIR